MIFKNSALNLLGMVIPTLVAIPAMGFMARILNPEQFGLFMLAFSVVGYASIFDGGLTRAVVRAVAGNNDNKAADRRVIGTATWTVLGLSACASVLIYGFAGQLVNFFNVSPHLERDACDAFEWLAFVMPPFLLGMVWFSYPEGQQKFFLLNSCKVMSGTLVALLPALALLFEPSLKAAIIGLLLARLSGLLFAYIPCRIGMGSGFFAFNLHVLKMLFSFGGWITFSNSISPLMAYADRFLLSNLLGAQEVAYYTAPSDAIARMSIVPGAVARTLFPLFSNRQIGIGSLASGAYKGLLLCTLLMVLPVFVFASPLLDLWLGSSYGAESSIILRILLLGFIFNSLAQIPFSKIQALGKSRLTAMIHLAELLPYLAILAALVYFFGLAGAAVAWTLRVIIDLLILEYFSRKVCAK